MGKYTIHRELTHSLQKDIQFLTSEETNGRVSGSKGAKVTADYLANQLSLIGAKPAGEDGYFSYLDIFAGRLTSEVILKIEAKKLRHRIDFGEISRYSNPTGNNVSGQLLIVRDQDEVEPNLLKGKVVLIPEKPKDFDLGSTVKAAEELGISALLIESGEPRWFHKGLQGSRENSIPVFLIRKEIVHELVKHEGGKVEIHLPLVSKESRCQNVLGLLSGRDSSKTLVLSAHYDHIGDDPNGFRFPGAVDNASGVAIVLETARNIKAKTLPFNILFAFFTGEESGLLGAKHFVKYSVYPKSAVINVDSLGFEPTLVKMRNGHKEAGNWLADLSAKIIKDFGVEATWIAGGEDSMAFQQEGITAIGLGQKPTDPAQRGIHSPEDNLDNLYMEPVEKAYLIIDELVHHIIKNPELLSIK